jgi:hypothetical protein
VGSRRPGRLAVLDDNGLAVVTRRGPQLPPTVCGDGTVLPAEDNDINQMVATGLLTGLAMKPTSPATATRS